MRFDTRIISSTAEFKGLRNEWAVLLQQSRTNTIFLTWEWLYSWWEVFGSGGKLFIVTVRDGQGALIGLAPLFVRKTRYYSMPVKEICFIGAGLSDRQDFLITDNDHFALHEIVSAICSHKQEWNIVQLDQIPGGSLLTSAGPDICPRTEREDSSTCPFVRIQGDWDIYYKGLGKKFHRDMKHKQNRLSRFGQWEFRTESVPNDNIGALIERIAETEDQSRKQRVKPFLSIRKNKKFLERFCSLSIPKGWFDFSSITVNDSLAAYLIGFRYNAKYYAYNMAFLETYHAASPGKLLLHQKLKWCFENSGTVEEFDFLRGDTYIKSLWTSETRQHSRVVFFDDSLYAGLLRIAVFRLRPTLKKLMKRQQENKVPVIPDTKG